MSRPNTIQGVLASFRDHGVVIESTVQDWHYYTVNPTSELTYDSQISCFAVFRQGSTWLIDSEYEEYVLASMNPETARKIGEDLLVACDLCEALNLAQEEENANANQ